MGTTVMGFGTQGMKAIKQLEKYKDTESWTKVFCDRKYDADLVSDINQFLMLDFEYEIGSGNPEIPIKYWLREENVREYFARLLKTTNFLIIAFGAGGTMSLAAKEVASYVRNIFPDLDIYIVMTIPFQREVEFKTRLLTHKLISYLEMTKGIGYSVIENENVLAESNGDFLHAYECTSEKMAKIIRCVVKFQIAGQLK